jgi:hypothetical protein
MAWNKSYPLSSTDVSTSVTQIQTNWDAIEGIIGVEHSTFTSTPTGTHLAGRTGVLYYGSTSEITGISSPGSGAIAYDSTLGVLKVNTDGVSATSWTRMTSASYSRAKVSKAEEQTIPTGAWTTISFTQIASSGDYDTLSEFSSASSTFTVTGPGYYFINGTVMFSADDVDYFREAAVYINASISTEGRGYGRTAETVSISDVRFIAAGGTIMLKAYHTKGSNAKVVNALLHVTRLS